VGAERFRIYWQIRGFCARAGRAHPRRADGFLGLDNIGVFDRSAPLPTGGQMDQADGTGWMALFAQTMLQIAVELAV
jgi:hypothetical protein